MAIPAPDFESCMIILREPIQYAQLQHIMIRVTFTQGESRDNINNQRSEITKLTSFIIIRPKPCLKSSSFPRRLAVVVVAHSLQQGCESALCLSQSSLVLAAAVAGVLLVAWVEKEEERRQGLHLHPCQRRRLCLPGQLRAPWLQNLAICWPLMRHTAAKDT